MRLDVQGCVAVPATVTLPGTIASAAGGVGTVVPGTLLTVGMPVSSVRPVASVIANVRFWKHPPLVMTSNPPPFTSTGTPTRLTRSGKLTCTRYGGVPPKM
ncbi:MAG: hypothetical protein KJ018_08855 [Burkholderiales bacterium]|nr:hypothetical protein [Burkholderiales bacterium]